MEKKTPLQSHYKAVIIFQSGLAAATAAHLVDGLWWWRSQHHLTFEVMVDCVSAAAWMSASILIGIIGCGRGSPAHRKKYGKV